MSQVKPPPRRALFLDRDGTITQDKGGYTYRVQDLAWLPGAPEAIAAANAAGWRVIVVTNQSGIGRGLFSLADMHIFHAAMSEDLVRHNARIDAFYFCPYHQDAVEPVYRVANHPDRKPNPGMLLRAIEDYSLDPATSLMVGDLDTDLQAARSAGVPAILADGTNLKVLIAPFLTV